MWDGKFSNLTVAASAYPDLHAELAKIQSPRERAERLRSLALAGLCAMRFTGAMVTGNRSETTNLAPNDAQAEPEQPKESRKKADLKGKLGKSLAGSLGAK